MGEKITTFVNVLVFDSASAVAKTKYFSNSQLLFHLRQVLDRLDREREIKTGMV
jgi:hypothetical protein